MGSVKMQVITCVPSQKRYTVGCVCKEQYRKPQTKVAKLVLRNKELGFDSIRDECLKQKALYEDPDFPAVDKSVFQSYWPWPGRSVEWKRPPVG